MNQRSINLVQIALSIDSQNSVEVQALASNGIRIEQHVQHSGQNHTVSHPIQDKTIQFLILQTLRTKQHQQTQMNQQPLQSRIK